MNYQKKYQSENDSSMQLNASLQAYEQAIKQQEKLIGDLKSEVASLKKGHIEALE